MQKDTNIPMVLLHLVLMVLQLEVMIVLMKVQMMILMLLGTGKQMVEQQ